MTRPVGSGKTALLLALCRALREEYNIGKLPPLRPNHALFSCLTGFESHRNL